MGVDYVKKNGSKVVFGLRPSNVMILELQLSDKKRKAKLEGTKVGSKKTSSPKIESKNMDNP